MIKRAATWDEHGGDGVNVLRVGATSFGRGTFLGKMVDYVSFYIGVVWGIGTLVSAAR